MVTAQAPVVPFEHVFDAHFDAVHAYLRRRVGDAAEDLAAETFARALAGYASFEPGRGELRAWLFGIATNLLHGHRRSEARRLRAYRREAGRSTAPQAEDADELARLDAIAQAAQAAVAIARLSREDRDVLLLVAWADLTYDEVASALGVPVGTVRSRLHRARAAVKAQLEEER